jgi:threonine dehydrogenase-like Zn-dependent dehydrogenase
MGETAVCYVQRGPQQFTIERLPIPDPTDDAALLRVEASGLCGSEVEMFFGQHPGTPYPFIPGHEVVGRIEQIGELAHRRWGVSEGDRVAVLSTLRCRICRACVREEPCIMRGSRGFGSYGWRELSEPPGLWGAFATHLYLAPETVVVPMSADLSLAAAAMFNPLANGIEWMTKLGAIHVGDRVVVLGAGTQGLACVFAAHLSGADLVIATGVTGDELRLQAARALGADEAIQVSVSDSVAAVKEYLPEGADVVIDTTSAGDCLSQALELAARRGLVLLSGFKLTDVPLRRDLLHAIVTKQLVIRGVTSKSVESLRRSVSLVQAYESLLARLPTRAYPLTEAAQAIRSLAGMDEGPRPAYVRVEPWT